MRYWIWKIVLDNGQPIMTHNYLNEEGFDCLGVKYFKDWDRIKKEKITSIPYHEVLL